MEEKDLYVRITIEGCPIVETRENFKKMMLGGDFAEIYFDVDYLAAGADCKIEMIEMSKAEFEALPQFDGF